jgi:hypothetical protein
MIEFFVRVTLLLTSGNNEVKRQVEIQRQYESNLRLCDKRCANGDDGEIIQI